MTDAVGKVTDTYQDSKNVSSPDYSLRGSDDDYTSGEVPSLICFAKRPVPKPVDFFLGKAIPRGYVTNLHGAGGFGKSVLAMLITISVAGYQKECLGLPILKHGDVLYLDSELDERGQHPRVREICKGLGILVPEQLHYISALGLDTATALERARAACKQLGITLLVIDSWGPFMQGDMESAKDVLRFYNEHLRPLVDLGVTVLIVDHQSRTQEGQNYQKKGAFGSVYKENLARSVLQIERVSEDRDQGTLQVRFRHRKSNFGPRLEPFDVTITFGADKITAKAGAIEEAEKASEETISSRDRVLAAVKNGPLTVKELVESTGLSTGTVRNKLSELVPGTLDAADLDGRTKVYGYPSATKNLSSSLPPKGGDSDDRSSKDKAPVSFDLELGEVATVAELKDRRDSTTPAGKCRHSTPGGCWLCQRAIQKLVDDGMKLKIARVEVLGKEA
jgi:archaellum biogenesis ATPase FlaH